MLKCATRIDKEKALMAKCKHCKDLRLETLPQGLFAKAQRCPRCFVHCPQCHGDGFLYSRDAHGRDLAQKCPCQEVDRRIELYNLAKIPAQFFDATLDNFDIRGNPSLSEALQMTKMAAKSKAQVHGHGLLFMGGVGMGKTRLVSSLVREYILTHGVPCLFQEFTSLLSEIKSGYDQGTSEEQLLSRISQVEVLVIDELGKGRKTDWEITILDSIISRRYNMQRVTHFTTNYTDQAKSTYRDAGALRADDRTETLQQRVYGRIYSRLKEMCHFVNMEGEDYRIADEANQR